MTQAITLSCMPASWPSCSQSSGASSLQATSSASRSQHQKGLVDISISILPKNFCNMHIAHRNMHIAVESILPLTNTQHHVSKNNSIIRHKIKQQDVLNYRLHLCVWLAANGPNVVVELRRSATVGETFNDDNPIASIQILHSFAELVLGGYDVLQCDFQHHQILMDVIQLC